MKNKYLYFLFSLIFFIHGCTYNQMNNLSSSNMKEEKNVNEYEYDNSINWNSRFMKLMTGVVIGLIYMSIPGNEARRVK